jgi:MFS family permease
VSTVARLFFGNDADILAETRFQLLLAAELVIVLGTSLVSPILDTLATVYAVSPAVIGLMVTAITAPAIVLIPIGGSLADWYGRRPVLIVGLLLFGGGGSALAFTTDFRVVLALRTIQGAGFAFTLPTLITTIRDLYGGQRESTGQGLRNATGGVSNALFPILAGGLVVVAWQLPFLLYGLALPVAVTLYVWFDEPADLHTNDARMDGNGGEPSTGGDGGRLRYTKQVLKAALRRRVAAILVARAFYSVAMFAFLTYISLVVANIFDGSPGLTALLISVWAGIYSIVSTQAGRVTGRWGYTGPLIVLHAGLGIGLILTVVGPSIYVAGLGVVCIAVGVGTGGALYRSLVTGFASKRLRAGLVSISEVLGRVGASVTPVVLGLGISVLEPDLGIALALQYVLGGTGLVTMVVGIGCAVVYWLDSPSNERPTATSQM